MKRCCFWVRSVKSSSLYLTIYHFQPDAKNNNTITVYKTSFGNIRSLKQGLGESEDHMNPLLPPLQGEGLSGFFLCDLGQGTFSLGQPLPLSFHLGLSDRI